MLSVFKSCPYKFKLMYIDNWAGKEPSVHLHAGAAFAKGIEVARSSYYIKHNSPEDAVAHGLEALLRAYGDFSCPPDSAKSAERMAGALEYYFTNYPLEHDTAVPITLPGSGRGIEFSFAHPLPITHPDSGDPLIYAGRMDAICDFSGGVFVVDEKTTSSLGSTWARQWGLRSQFTGYAWGCQQAGIAVDGVLVRGIAILKTKYDTQQALSYRPKWLVDRWYEETIELIEHMVDKYNRLMNPAGVRTRDSSFTHNYGDTCADFGGCGFMKVCESESELPHLETTFEKRIWDPILRIEHKP